MKFSDLGSIMERVVTRMRGSVDKMPDSVDTSFTIGCCTWSSLAYFQETQRARIRRLEGAELDVVGRLCGVFRESDGEYAGRIVEVWSRIQERGQSNK